MPSNLLIRRKEAGEREGERGTRLEKREMERSGEGRKRGREVGELNSEECCGLMTGNQAQDRRAERVESVFERTVRAG